MDFDVPLRPGDMVDGKYRVEGFLAQGGMGVVLAATHLALGQPVALKLLKQSAASDRVLVERFLREARASFRLRSENTVRVLDVGQLPGGLPYIVMELLEGQDLREVLQQRGGGLPEAEAVEYLLQVTRALQEAHALGIVHRDLKPRNLFLTRRVDGTPIVKVLDFGISKVLGEDGEQGPLTQPQMAIGSPRYMAPEQWKASPLVDARADIYSLGVILFELLTGQVPLRELAIGELMRRMAAGAMPSPRDLRPDVSEAVAKVVLKALRPYPEERYQTVTELAAALTAALPVATEPETESGPLSTTSATAVVPRDVLEARARALGMPAPPMSTRDDGPSTRREGASLPTPEPMTSPLRPRDRTAPMLAIPAAAPPSTLAPSTLAPSALAPSHPVSAPPVPLAQTLASSAAAQVRPSAGATLQSAVAEEVRARVEQHERERALAPFEVTLEDQTRVDPPPHFGGALHATPAGPRAHAHPIAFPEGMAPPPPGHAVPPGAPPLPPWPHGPMVVTVPRPAPAGRAGTVVAIVLVVVLGVLAGGGLAYFFVR
jgi:serine/threonine-protein kinase